jgi:WD40 repeat protein
MKKIIFLLCASLLFALTSVKPYKFVRYDYYISKITYNKNYLIAGLENGQIVIKNFNTLKNLYSFKLPKIHDFMGDLISMPIYSLDISPNGKNLLILAEGEDAIRILFIFNLKNHTLKKIFTTKNTLMKARYITNNKVLFGLLSDELILYDLKNKKQIYRIQEGNYVFSTYALNNSKTKVAIGDESGAVKVVRVNDGKRLKEIIAYNKDKTLSLDYQQNLIINGSSDMRVGVYTDTGITKVTLKAKFLPYAAAISPKLDTFAIQYDEKNNIMVYSMYKKPLFLLKGHTMPLNGMKYLNENTIISFSPAELIIWKLK